MRISDLSSAVCSSDLVYAHLQPAAPDPLAPLHQRAARLQVGADGHGSVVVEDADQVRVAVTAGRWRPGHPDPHHHAVAPGDLHRALGGSHVHALEVLPLPLAVALTPTLADDGVSHLYRPHAPQHLTRVEDPRTAQVP